MSAVAGSLPTVDGEAIEAIAQDFFATMVDGEHGVLVPGYGEMAPLVDARFTWVDVHGETVTRVLVAVGRSTGDMLTRALLALPDDAPIGDADFADAAGEVVNVIGGNIKSLVHGGGALSLPQVADAAPDCGGAPLISETWFTWRGAPLTLTLWNLPEHAGSAGRP
ncbi:MULTISPECIES: chemotaxis protein CheX [Demequina]|uniref:Chemotaxis phosphatase CheX-like domain-containing protein n=1 Tax=Demequina litorisediminis TaxID=1849022 RepID=A0ABQ6IFX0_9MICO|nr:chemotaxis protein CheX [Demequina litorisediminis]GMA35624.1 hypothetical protein GCM10025876_18280 [Demequina litorisediminis]